MTWVLIDSGTFAFADGNAGHVCDLGGAPAANDLDVLCVNSDTLVNLPDGFTLADSAVNSQGAYVFFRKATGVEGSTVTVTTVGNFNAQVSWSRWSGSDALDVASSSQIDGSAGTVTPAHSTGVLADADELVIAFAALHNFSTAPAAPVWSTGYDPVTAVSQGAGTSGVAGLVGYRTDAGPAAETPSVTWTNGVANRYIITATFTADPGAPAPDDLDVTVGEPIDSWSMSDPVTAWSSDAPVTSWSAAPPTT